MFRIIKMPISPKKIAIAGVSLAAMMGAGCASHSTYANDGYRTDYSSYDRYSNARANSNAAYNDVRYRDQRSDDGRRDLRNADFRGIDGARVAHARFPEYRAEELDGDCEQFVKIRRGETLSDLAEFCDVPVASIINVNPRLGNPRYVSAGETVEIPSVRGNVYEGSERYGYRTVDYRRDTPRYDNNWFGRAGYDRNYYRDYSQRVDYLKSADRGVYYTVRPGDTLSEIAQRYDVALRDIAYLNPRLDPYYLQIGDRVFLPDYARSEPWSREVNRVDYRNNWRAEPIVSISPRTGRPGSDIRVYGEGFPGETDVNIFVGQDENSLSEYRKLRTDQYGRIAETIRLPEDYGYEKATIALRGQDQREFAKGELFAIEGYQAIGQSPYTQQPTRVGHDWAGRASLAPVQQEIAPGEPVRLVAEGFPPDTPVSIYAGPNRRSTELVAETRTNSRGAFEINAAVPDTVTGPSVLFIAAVEDGADTIVSDAVRVVESGSRYDRSPYRRTNYQNGNSTAEVRWNNEPAASPTKLERGIEKNRGILNNRFRRTPNSNGGVKQVATAGSLAVAGVLTAEGTNCPTLRDDSGNLYSLLGELGRFQSGDRVLIKGTASADDRICGEAETVQVYTVQAAPW